MSNLASFEKRVFSQNCEDGVTLEIIKRLYNEDQQKFFVEFGTENGHECNTRILRDKADWSGLLMDGSHENKQINLHKHFITKKNIVSLLQQYHVPRHFQLLSIDIDYNDFYVLHEIVKKFEIDIIVCEYNATHNPTEDKVVVYDENGGFNGSNYFGASLCSFQKLLNAFDYSLVYTEKMGVNAFFVHKKMLINNASKFNLVDEIATLYHPPAYGNGPNRGHVADALNRKYVTSEEARILN